ncbi:MAG: response regulator [Candidatus Acidiferrum sp.]|jgi:DNA-binding response OmpR family regulator
MNDRKILIVEDDLDLNLGYEVFLKVHHTVFFAVDVQSAVSEAIRVQPDLIILDLGLPGEDGYVALERFQENPSLSTVPVIVVSGRDPATHKNRALKAGAKAFIQKPWNSAALLSTIDQYIGSVDCT